MAELLDTELLKDLRGLGKPPSFDGNDSEYQDFRFSSRIHMSLVSPVSHTLVDKKRSRVEISLTAVNCCSWERIPTVPLFEQPCCNDVIHPETLERIRPRQLEM